MDEELVFSDKLVSYCVSVSQEFQARLNRIRFFVKHNNLISGNANEAILRDFLTKHAPQAFQVGQGFICNPLQDYSVSRQCDILIYDQSHHPLVYEDGPVKIAWPDSIRMVIETKTQFGENDIKTAIENISSAKSVERIHEDIVDFAGFIFAFNSAGLDTVKQHLETYIGAIPKKDRPDAILLFDQGIIICKTPETNLYRIEKAVEQEYNGAIVLTFLLLHFFDVVWRYPGIGIAEMLRQMQLKHTKRQGIIEIAESRVAANKKNSGDTKSSV